MRQEGPSLSGRRAQAARNDQRILEAARAVFVADPEAPISRVATEAGVGISALYRRYAGKEDLLRWLCRDGLRLYVAEAEAALADEGDPWAAFTAFMRRIVEADTASLTLRLAGTFTPTEDLYRDANRAQELNVRLVERLRAAGAIRPDVDVNDLALIFEQLAAIRVGDEDRTRRLRERYLALLLDALQIPSRTRLPGPAPSWQEISGRWDPRVTPREGGAAEALQAQGGGARRRVEVGGRAAPELGEAARPAGRLPAGAAGEGRGEMSQTASTPVGEGHEIEVTRAYDAPRELVFDVWTKGDHLKNWYAPAPFTVPEVESDPTEGGTYRLAMRSPEGQVFWSEGTYREVVPPERFVMAQGVLGPDGKPLFEAITTVTLTDEGGKTTVTVHERVEKIFDPAAAGPLSGMEQGLHMVLDNLTEYLRKL